MKKVLDFITASTMVLMDWLTTSRMIPFMKNCKMQGLSLLTSVKKLILPNKKVVLSSFFMILGSMIAGKCFDTDSILYGICACIFTIGHLFAIIALRTTFLNRQYPLGGRWAIAVTWLLWISLLIVPFTSGVMYIWWQFSDPPDGMANLRDSIFVLLFVGTSICVAYITASLAYLIQLYRDQWRVKLSFVVMILLFLIYVFYIFLMCGGEWT